MSIHAPSRRELLLGSGVLFAWAHLPKAARAEGRDPRLLTIVLRGALDGLATVAPVGDPDWPRLRGDKALALAGPHPALPLDGFFALNPAMPNLHRLYAAGHATIVHAAATPYRERSHFDGQDVLESGLGRPGMNDTGWLNRALTALEPAGLAAPARAGHNGREAFAVGPVVPLVVRGPAPVLSWTPPRLPPASDDTVMRLLDLYRHTDPALARVLEERLGLAAIARAGGIDEKGKPAQPGPAAQVRQFFAESAGTAAKFMARPDGPRVGALAFDGWDTHADEGAVGGRLAALLGALDGAIAAIETEMGSAWGETVVVVVTEFRVRTHRAHQRDRRHRPRDLDGGAARRRRAAGRPRRRRLARAARCRPSRRSRSQTDHRPARRAQGRAQGPSAAARVGARLPGLSRQRLGEADAGARPLGVTRRAGSGRPRQEGRHRGNRPDRTHGAAPCAGLLTGRQPGLPIDAT